MREPSWTEDENLEMYMRILVRKDFPDLMAGSLSISDMKSFEIVLFEVVYPTFSLKPRLESSALPPWPSSSHTANEAIAVLRSIHKLPQATILSTKCSGDLTPSTCNSAAGSPRNTSQSTASKGLSATDSPTNTPKSTASSAAEQKPGLPHPGVVFAVGVAFAVGVVFAVLIVLAAIWKALELMVFEISALYPWL
jgi:hypothetical protein